MSESWQKASDMAGMGAPCLLICAWLQRTGSAWNCLLEATGCLQQVDMGAAPCMQP